MRSARLLGALLVSFAVGVLVGAGLLWLVQDGGPELNPAARELAQTALPGNAAQIAPDAIEYSSDMTTIEYEVITDGMSVTHLSYVNVVDGEPVMEESLGSPPPFRHVMQFPNSEGLDLAKLSVTGMGAATSTTTTCTLRVDGEVVSRQTTDGVYGLVTCQLRAGDQWRTP